MTYGIRELNAAIAGVLFLIAFSGLDRGAGLDLVPLGLAFVAWTQLSSRSRGA